MVYFSHTITCYGENLTVKGAGRFIWELSIYNS